MKQCNSPLLLLLLLLVQVVKNVVNISTAYVRAYCSIYSGAGCLLKLYGVYGVYEHRAVADVVVEATMVCAAAAAATAAGGS